MILEKELNEASSVEIEDVSLFKEDSKNLFTNEQEKKYYLKISYIICTKTKKLELLFQKLN